MFQRSMLIILLMKTRFTVLIFIAAFLSAIYPATAVDPNCLTFIGSVCIACKDSYEVYFGWCWPKDAYCLIFAASGCATCSPGFQLLQGWCYYPDPYCQTFSLGSCIVCKTGSMLYEGWCLPLNTKCTNFNQSVCTACASGTYLDDGNCYPDQSQINCKTLTPQGCLACNDAYQYANGYCIIPDTLFCQTFQNNQCIVCKGDNQLAQGRCYSPDSNCLAKNGSVCTECKNGLYLSFGWCFFHSSKCQTNTPNGCTLCKPGYSAINGQCHSPDPNCQVLTPNGCNLCIFGYQLTFGVCNSLCQIHDSTGACTKCPLGYILRGDLCVPINSTVPCLYFNSKGFCYVCPTNYALYNGQCYAFIPNCQIYSPATGGCQTCQQGYSGNSTYCALCNNLSQSSDASCLLVGGGITAVNINGSFVPCGPGCLFCAYAGSDQKTRCVTPQKGYFLAGGLPIKCISQTCLTCIQGKKTCKSCFEGYTLVAGNCLACIDSNATYCLPTNLNYSVLCYPKYSVSTSLPKCQPCAANCLKCNANGPGNCDSSQCMLGFVQIVGTLNCTACINSCPVCNETNLKCIDCGPYRFSDGNGSCLACPSKCVTCSSASNCSKCQLGGILVNSTCRSNIGYPCAIISLNSLCSLCFQGYVLNGSSICVLAPPPNNTYTQCPYGYYLSNYSCLSCPLSKCQACTSNVSCTLCVKGYFIKAGTCFPCLNGCSDCLSATYCNQAADGYYLQGEVGGSNRGKVQACSSPCLNCQQSSDFCLTCIDGYDIQGIACISNSSFNVQIVLGPSSSGGSIFSQSDSNDKQLSEATKNVKRLLNSFCQILQNSLKLSDSSCKNVFRLISIAIGSIVMNIDVDQNMVANTDKAKDSIYLKLISQGLDGATVLSADIEGYEYTAPSSDSTPQSASSKLPLILGVSIGAGVLAIIIVTAVLVVIKKRKDQQDEKKYRPPTIEELIRTSNNFVIKEGGQMDVQYCIGPSASVTPASIVPQIKQIFTDNSNSSNKSEENDDEVNNPIKNIRLSRAESLKKSRHFISRRIIKILDSQKM